MFRSEFVNFIERTRLEKAAADCGYDLTPEVVGQDLVLRSTQFPESITVSVSDSGTFHLMSSEPALLMGLTQAGGKLANVEGYAGLYVALEKIAAAGRTMPNRVAEKFKRMSFGMPLTTEAERLVVQRVGQNLFREALLDYWDGRCCVTGLAIPDPPKTAKSKPATPIAVHSHDADESITVAEFDAASNPADVDHQSKLAGALANGSFSVDALKAMTAILLGSFNGPKDGKRKATGEVEEPTEEEAERKEKTSAKIRNDFAWMWGKFKEILQPARDKAAMDQSGDTARLLAAIIEIMLASVVRVYRGRSLDDPEGALRQIGAWLSLVTDFDHMKETKIELLESVSGASAVLARLYMIQKTDPYRASETAPNGAYELNAYRRVGYLLEYFYQGAVNVDEVIKNARTWLRTDIGSALVDDSVDEALSALELTLGEETTIRRAHRHIESKIKPVPGDFPEFGKKQLQSLIDACAKSASPKGKTYCEVPSVQAKFCPCCHALTGGTSDLKQFGIYECSTCRKKLVLKYDPSGKPLRSAP